MGRFLISLLSIAIISVNYVCHAQYEINKKLWSEIHTANNIVYYSALAFYKMDFSDEAAKAELLVEDPNVDRVFTSKTVFNFKNNTYYIHKINEYRLSTREVISCGEVNIIEKPIEKGTPMYEIYDLHKYIYDMEKERLHEINSK